jgi:hypothetical protein
MIMLESEGITESVETWRTDVVAQIIDALGIENTMFEAADPAVFEWYIKNYGADANLFVDHSQIVQLECLRSGIWGTKSSWGRMMTQKETNRFVTAADMHASPAEAGVHLPAARAAAIWVPASAGKADRSRFHAPQVGEAGGGLQGRVTFWLSSTD